MEETNEVANCVECGEDFEITEGWKQLVIKNPDMLLPKRCYPCRQKKKAEKKKMEYKGNSY